MATKKKLLQAAAGSASGGAGALNVEDVFSTYLYEGNGSSQVIENGINLGQSNGSGSADFDGNDYITSSSGYLTSIGTGDFTIEGWWYFKDFTARTYFARCWSFGTGISNDVTLSVNTSGQLQYRNNDSVQFTGSSSLSTNGWNHLALCRNSGTTTLYLNGISVGSASNNVDFSTVANNSFYVGVESDGNGGYMNGYASNIRIVNGTAVYTSNFTSPTSELTAISGTSLLTLQGDSPFVDNSTSALTITQNGDPKASSFGPFDAADAGEGGLVWIKKRASTKHILMDSERGLTDGFLSSDLTNGTTASSTQITSLNSSGFSIGNNTDVNQATVGYNKFASWTFRKAPKFFDVVTFTVPTGGASQTISHNLDAPVGFVITKLTSSGTANWYCFHTSRPNKYLSLDLTSAEGSWTWSSTNTEIDIGAFYSTNFGGETGVAYFFAHNDGDGDFGPTGDQDIIKCGSCAGASVTVDLGFEPQLLITKAYDTSSNWHIQDNMRTFDRFLQPQASDAEVTDTTNLPKITSTGFEVPSTFLTSSNMIYMAIRRGPMAVPTDATEVFAIDQGINASVGDRVFNSGFPVDLMIRTDPTGTYNRLTLDRLRGNGAYVVTNDTDAETDTAYAGEFDDMEGVFTDTSFDFSNHYAYMWRRASGYMDAVAYTGNGTVNHQISHNLQAVPELLLFKPRGSGSWIVKSKFDDDASGVSTRTNYLLLNYTNAYSTSADYRLSSDETSFTLSTNGGFDNGAGWNTSGDNYIAYLFASVDGVSKVGSYTGTGAGGNQIDCGFSSGARFVLIKAASSAGSWNVFDTERGIVAGNDARLKLNNTNAEDSTQDIIDPYNSGFELANDAGDTNSSGVTYIFYAIA